MSSSVIMGCAMFGVALILLCVNRPVIGFAVCFLLFIPAPLYPTPEFGWLFYGFAGFTLAVLIGWLARLHFRKGPFQCSMHADRIGLSLTLWLVLCSIGLPLSVAFNQGDITDRLFFYGKGVVPFVYLLVFFVVRALPVSMRQYQRILNYLVVVAIAFAIFTFGIYGVTQARVTWLYAPLQFPFVVLGANVAFVRSLMTESRRAAMGWGLVTALLALAAILTFTKALIIALVGSLALEAFLAIRNGSRRSSSRIITFGVSVTILAAGTVFLSSAQVRSNFVELVSARLSDSTSTESRFSEWESALTQFAQSPVIGKGVGYQLERDVGGDTTLTTGYVHNQIAYSSMTMGITGLFVFGLLVYQWGRSFFRKPELSSQMMVIWVALHGCVFTLVAYAEMFATFRTIQHNFVLGVLLAMIVKIGPSEQTRAHMQTPSVAI